MWFLILIVAFLVFACVLVPLLALAIVAFIDRRPERQREIDGKAAVDWRPQE